MKNILGIITIIILLIANICCNENSTVLNNDRTTVVPSNERPVVIIPLAVGNKWIYQGTYYDQFGSVTLENCDSSIILKDTIINSEKWYLPSGITPNYITNRSEGLYSYTTKPTLWLKYPVVLGDSIMRDASVITKVISLNDSVQIGAKYYLAHVYKTYINYSKTIQILFSIDYIVPNIGVVKGDMYDGYTWPSHIVKHIQLISYELY